MRAVLFFTSLACLILAVVSPPGTYTGSFALYSTGYASHGPYSFVGNAGNNTAEIQLTFIGPNSVTQLMMLARTTNIPPTPSEQTVDYYAHKNPNATSIYDLQNSNSGQRQVVNIGGLSSGDAIFIFVVNFNSLTTTNYTVTVTERMGYNPAFCAVGNPLSSTGIYCSSCANSMSSGSFCDISNSILSSNVTYSLQLYGWNDTRGNFGTMTIPAASNQFTLYYTATNINIISAVQFKYFSSEVAGIMNYATNGLKSLSQYNTQYSVPVTTGGLYDISVSFLNLNSVSVNLSIWYSVQTTSNILVIVLAVLGGILFVGLVVVAICIIRRMRHPEQQVNPLSAILVRGGTVRINNPNDLNTQEIETYFPSVLCKNVISEDEQHSQINLNVEKEKEADRDCVICLCPIVSTEMIKVTYCRHVFHAQCLNKWFQKQRNCPYCREEYNRKSTIEHYQTILGITHKNMLSGIELVKQLLVSRLKSQLVIEEIKE